jgi:protein TonB
MSKIRLASTLAGSVCILAAACWIAAGALPLTAQTAPDGAGVSVDLGSSAVMHRTGISYPASALARRVEGTVVAQVTLDAVGNVTDARVVAGPDELRKAVLQSVLQWHFTRDAANGTRQVSVTFQAPPQNGQTGLSGTLVAVPPVAVMGPVPAGAVAGVLSSGVVVGPGATPAPAVTVKSINVYGLPDQARAELLASLPVHEGDTLMPEAMPKIPAAVREFDEHLAVSITGAGLGSREVDVVIVAPGAAVPRRASASVAAGTTTTGGSIDNLTQAQPALIRQVQPLYPPLARQARIQGTVVMNAILTRDGAVQNVAVVSGHPLLVQAAIDAVKQWVYQPTLVNGQPVEVSTQIHLNFTLADQPPVQQ